jgi:hypothetical protein
MPLYNYICDDCVAISEKKLNRETTDEEKEAFVFEVFHTIKGSAKEIAKVTKCPLCSGHNTKRTLIGSNQSFRILGGDWHEFKKKNAAALQRDMALHQLQNNDPYGYMRPAGDKADLIDKLRAGSKKKTKKKHFLT